MVYVFVFQCSSVGVCAEWLNWYSRKLGRLEIKRYLGYGVLLSLAAPLVLPMWPAKGSVVAVNIT